MQKSITFKNASIYFSDEGKGNTVVLLHGFLENKTMWKNIVPELSKRNRIVTLLLLLLALILPFIKMLCIRKAVVLDFDHHTFDIPNSLGTACFLLFSFCCFF